MLSRDLLSRLATSWHKRARVRAQVDVDLLYDTEKEDFLDHLLPFADHPLYQAATPELRSTILSCGWLLYNAKTITIETDIVNPVCVNLLNEKFPGVNGFLLKKLITETMVDESYHVHLCVYANEMTKQHRNISVRLPVLSFIKKMQIEQANYAKKWQQDLIQLATAITSEIYITDYLELIHDDKTDLQPLNQLIVKTHRSDELVHGKIFDHLARLIFHHLSKREKAFFMTIMDKPIQWLMDLEWESWLVILTQIGFNNAYRMIEECKTACHLRSLHSSPNKGIEELISLRQQLVS